MADIIPQPEFRIIALARSFPCLCDIASIARNQWDPATLDQWAAAGASSGETHTVRFVLGVWNQWENWKCGSFDLFEAIDIWDLRHREAFLEWAANPWFA